MFFVLVLFMQACQSPAYEGSTPSKKSTSLLIDENNYIYMSQYNYARFSIVKNRRHLPANSKYRSYPGTNATPAVKDLLQISALPSDDQNTDIMLIKQNSTNIVVKVNKNNNSVTISYDDGIKTLEKSMTFDTFQNLEGEALS
jgi:hypothetical protein